MTSLNQLFLMDIELFLKVKDIVDSREQLFSFPFNDYCSCLYKALNDNNDKLRHWCLWLWLNSATFRWECVII